MLISTVFSTGLSTFSNPSTIGPMYPGVGIEWLLVIIVFVAWLAWHIRQFRDETKDLKKEAEHFRKTGLEKVLSRKPHRDTMQ